ncbi:MAG: tRNA (adenosine(37)-N6)-threonylcarbamoyltransferase complex dimerization subunit type 1 TsaB [Bacteroidetes bacterium GWF2_42_66]|nr:MAG: tRNA (adenosine(37)-N6)-threonylcarbamoyltransferase complex dimerization subunit type 1 TsaB [Bacteroidetes bacterium GWA2_42_15]OFX96997.1 MAG: tRNA (adenosine(37)-N6)-threonylcarbamoyltransferase complex dimerization subunit type 1 TsaB [Bacteroidetes bacterium GWE2_42_39]OFY46003.1 MAG: tRNA (adenosine(37)-N6)-threonylcarbamoyltransferase complex dimerization subunit type 1 TsaB [Bacteroidetes bacterium GWF2_42_66]HCR92071.1 tRNA (adenosine(37)-N6)-threonylcarbamoyltransferase comple
MATILILESSTEVCSVALSDNGKLTDIKEDKNGQNHARLLTVFVEQLLTENKIPATGIDAVAVSMGPGSYTGLRIGISAAKGFCYANQIPLIAVSTLKAMAQKVIRDFSQESPSSETKRLYCPMMDARRMEVYTCLLDEDGTELEPVSAKIITEDSFQNELQQNTIVFFGNGAMKCKTKISHPNALFLDNIHASAALICEPAYEAYTKKHFEDVAYFEPFYLKDFVATIPKNNVLGK